MLRPSQETSLLGQDEALCSDCPCYIYVYMCICVYVYMYIRIYNIKSRLFALLSLIASACSRCVSISLRLSLSLSRVLSFSLPLSLSRFGKMRVFADRCLCVRACCVCVCGVCGGDVMDTDHLGLNLSTPQGHERVYHLQNL
jgi:hypothetical protein